jgi:hypothetical protein
VGARFPVQRSVLATEAVLEALVVALDEDPDDAQAATIPAVAAMTT